MTSVLGIHHVTAIASDPQRNLDFYAGVLGLRLVKRTVNFDDPESYHFYFGDEFGTPGSILTFFPWPGARSGRPGSGQVAVVSFAIAPAAIGFWLERLLRFGVKYRGPNQQVISFNDPDGLLLELVADGRAAARPAWGGAAAITSEQAIHGLHSATIWAGQGEDTERVLVDTLGFTPLGQDGATRRFGIGGGGLGTLVNVRRVGGFPRGVSGAGTVHHIAWRAADERTQLVLRDRVIAAKMEPTPVVDRKYFHSVYFHEPGGVLFELATDGPGFTVDEPTGRLGEALQLPAGLAGRRLELEAALPPIHLPAREAAPRRRLDVPDDGLGFIHRYIPPSATAEHRDVTLLLLHGTGGDEDDLLPLGSSLLPGAGVLSPRGKVLENGAPRFFRRLAEGVFDQDDLARRTDELSQFIESAIAAYELERSGIIAVGFSNGANIAASLLLRRPGELRHAVLLSPMLPFVPDHHPDLFGTAVFIGAGDADPIATRENTEILETTLRRSGADVTVHWTPGGHGVTPDELEAARDWMASRLAARSAR